MNAHTPGPWRYCGCGKCGQVWSTARDVPVCDVLYSRPDDDVETPSREVATANARLIAAAPDLLEALQGILEIGKRDTTNPKYDGYFEVARAALLKARGA